MPASNGLDSWYRAAELLEVLRLAATPLGVSALSDQLGMPKSTIARYLGVLQEVGFVRQAPGDVRYQLGPALYLLGRAVPVDALVRDAARPYLRTLTREEGETSVLAIVDGDSVLCIEKIESPHAMRLTARVGERVPLHCGATPRCLLAYLPESERDAYLARPLAALSPRTITDPVALRAGIDEARARGYIVTRGEIDEGMISVAAPIPDGQGSVVAAVSLAGPAIRLTEERLPGVIARVRATAEAIGAAWMARTPGAVPVAQEVG
jgi:DNA-binding IclR family transcriptional regulator